MKFFLSKWFGHSSSEQACLVIHDNALEIIQFVKNGSVPQVTGFNRADLPSGIVQNGSIEQESALTEAIIALCAEARPRPISAKELWVSIPFEHAFPFVKVFSKYTKEEDMQMNLMDYLEDHIPFEKEELDYNFYHHFDTAFAYGVCGYPKKWSHVIRESFREIGLSAIHFIPQPMSYLVLCPHTPEPFCALFTRHNGKIYLSLFYHHLLFDTFALKTGHGQEQGALSQLPKEMKSASAYYQSVFNQKITDIYFAGFSSAEYQTLEKSMTSAGLSCAFLDYKNKFPPDSFMPANYSPTLAGLVLCSIKNNP